MQHWWVLNIFSLPLLLTSPWLGAVVPVWHGSNKSVQKLFLSFRNSWNHITPGKLSVFKIVIWSYTAQSAGSGAMNTPTAPLQRGKTPSNEYPGYDIKQSDGDALVMLELWEMQSTLSLLSLPGPLCPGVVAPDKFLSMGQIELSGI